MPHDAGDGPLRVVAYGHMTTGGSAWSAPSTAGPGHPELRRVSQGDALCDMLLARGVAVLRPDYEGIGGPGIHPYLIAASLGESMRAMVAARTELDPRLGDDWVAAGHSEGSMAALAAASDGQSARARELWCDLDGKCLTELAASDSWGGLAPARIGGGRRGELYGRLFAAFRENEVARMVPITAPVRVDAGCFDEVAPAFLTRRLLRHYRHAGADLTTAWWPTHHSGVMHPQHAPSQAADWIIARFATAQ